MGEHATVQFENRYRCQDGSYRWLTWHATTDPEIRLVYASAHNITERKEVLQLKDEFISTVSHELRTPLTSINGSLGLRAEGVTGALPEKANGLVGIARSNCDRLIRLINDILDIEKIESGRMDYHIGVLDLGTLVTQAIEANEAFANQFDVYFTVEDRAAGATVRADSGRLLQVLTNLLSNAAKFSPTGDQVAITITRRNEQIRVTVTDNGLGIPPKFRTHIFEKKAYPSGSGRINGWWPRCYARSGATRLRPRQSALSRPSTRSPTDNCVAPSYCVTGCRGISLSGNSPKPIRRTGAARAEPASGWRSAGRSWSNWAGASISGPRWARGRHSTSSCRNGEAR